MKHSCHGFIVCVTWLLWTDVSNWQCADVIFTHTHTHTHREWENTSE